MSFSFPGKQAVTTAQPPVRQVGRTVSVAAPTDRPGAGAGRVDEAHAGRALTGSNTLPVEFKVGGSACGVQVSGIAGSVPITTAPKTKAPAKPPTKTTAKSGPAKAKPAPKPKAEPPKPGKAKGKENGKGKGRRTAEGGWARQGQGQGEGSKGVTVRSMPPVRSAPRSAAPGRCCPPR